MLSAVLHESLYSVQFCMGLYAQCHFGGPLCLVSFCWVSMLSVICWVSMLSVILLGLYALCHLLDLYAQCRIQLVFWVS